MNTHHLWFKRRRYGFGWTPVTWQGWVVVSVFLAFILGGALYLSLLPEEEGTKFVGWFLASVLALALGLIAISIKKGPTPKWRWGKKSTDSSEEDF